MKSNPTGYFKKTILTALALAMSMTTQAYAAPEDVTITFLEINDLHANLIGHKDIVSYPDGTSVVGVRGGMARMKTVIDRVEQANPNTVVMNIGDTYHGGVEAFFSLGNAVSDPLNALGIDVGVPGNWDYYFTPAVTRARYGRVNEDLGIVEATLPGLADPFTVKRPNFPNLGANVRDITDPLPQDFLPATHMLEYNGVKVGFIGFTSDIVEMMQPMLAEGMDFAWGLEEHKELLIKYSQELRSQGADIVVVMSELGIHKDMGLAKALEEMAMAGELPEGLIDVFFSAHTHEVTFTPVTECEDGAQLYAPVVESGNDGYMGRMDITMQYIDETTTGRFRNRSTEQNWTIKNMDWSLIAIDESIPEDPEVKALVDKSRAPFLKQDTDLMAMPFFMQKLNQPIDTVIGHLEPGSILHQNEAISGVLDRKQSLESSFNNAFTDMIAKMTGTEVAITPGFRMGATIPEAEYIMENNVIATGEITVEDAYRFFPMYYGLATATTTGAHLKEMIEGIMGMVYSCDTWNTRGGWNYGYAGLDLTVDLEAGDLSRLVDLRHSKDGTLVEDDEVLTISGCRRLPIDFPGYLCGVSGFENVTDVRNPTTGLPWSMVDVFIHQLQDNGYSLEMKENRIVDISQVPMWPANEFIQGLEGYGTYSVPHSPEDPCGFFKMNCVPQ